MNRETIEARAEREEMEHRDDRCRDIRKAALHAAALSYSGTATNATAVLNRAKDFEHYLLGADLS